MMIRCLNPRHRNYLTYCASGVRVCDRGRDFRDFFADMGERADGATLGRILDMGSYEPRNVFWQTREEQALAQMNKRALLRWDSSRATLSKPPTGVGLGQIAVA